ncbi:MAG: phosphocholine cytidylyltransferase family protein [Nitrospira sp.]|nr:phosphocholine cytidylyltransferase family protein [Nitrospira sp.]MDH4371308.1 phosphocholine cytidylyltransferase family protein [Nitrospira sp.]MDH5498871.1 phosphocholine cytidylyltransferase family protein [Nitrospira sp.]MDH5725853.1 phosphocholine cytidylyltransferase family protein [Nitrospira sp.]
MKAIILAAGVGKRLWEITQHRPKCLIEIGGRSLLHRYLQSLSSVGIRRVDIVVGYKQEMIRAVVEQDSCGLNVTFLVNEQFHRGSISSLWIARTAFDDDTIVMDADVLFHREILRRLVSSPHENVLLMDETVKQTGEESMVVVAGGRVIALTKKMPEQYDYAGEGVGFLRVRHADTPRVISSLRDYIDRGIWDMEYEDALLAYFQDVRVGHEKIGGLPWTEIDFIDDVKKAELEVWPRL